MLEVRGLRKRYITDRGEVVAVKSLDLDVAQGEFVTLLGPSGCGKTTTLRSIAGLELPDAGEISIGSTTVFSSTARREVPIDKRNLGLVFQSYAVWPHMTVAENVAFPLRVMKPRPSGATIKERVRKTLALVHLEELADRPVPQLSGGQQQRVALARALVREPPLLLLDEPLSNLDAKLRSAMRTEIADVVQQTGVATVYVTHDQVEALAMSDRIVVMLQGEAIQEGTPEEVYGHPTNRFVAEFLGDSNLIPGRIVKNANAKATVETSIGNLCSSQFSDDAAIGDEVLVCIRPENLTVLDPDTSLTENVYTATVGRMTYLGSHRNYVLKSGKVQLVATQPPGVDFDPGVTVKVHVDPDLSPVIPEDASHASLAQDPGARASATRGGFASRIGPRGGVDSMEESP